MEGCTAGNIFILRGNCFTCGWIFAVYRLYWCQGSYTINTTSRSRGRVQGSGSHWLYLNWRVACILGRKWLVIGCKKVWRVRTCLDPFNYKKFLDLLLWIQCWVQTVLSGPCSQLCLGATKKSLILHAACMLNTLDFIGSELVTLTSKFVDEILWCYYLKESSLAELVHCNIYCL